MPASLILNGESGRSTQANDATMGDTDVAPPGINTATDYLINNMKSDSGSGHKRKGQELAQQAIVRPRRHLCQVAMTTVMHAIGTFCLRCHSTVLMYMERRDNQHWQKHCQ